MAKLQIWIEAARLRTLPLSVSGILIGSGYAIFHHYFNWIIFCLAICTTLLFQILSNFANDYGDGVKGTDNQNRIGPDRAFQTGKISKKKFKTALIITSIFSFVSALTLILYAFGIQYALLSIFFLLLSVLSVWAAIKYTVGSSAYGYNGLGDLFVFIFFGLVSVCGSYMLYTKTIDWQIVLGGVGIGLLSTAVLNLNNMRDHESDKASGKNTLVVHLGFYHAKLYHALLIIIAIVVLICFYFFAEFSKWIYISLLTIFVLQKNLFYVLKIKNSKDLDQELKKVALSTFCTALLFFIVQLVIQT